MSVLALFTATVSILTPAICERMAYSWRDDNPVPIEELRYVTVSHWGIDGQVYTGELIVHRVVVQDIIDIFNELFEAGYPVEKMRLVDVYQAVDEDSAADNNSYSFCSRAITGKPGTFSKHSYGLAIDLNPLFNPYHKGDIIIPRSGARYLDRTLINPATLSPTSPCYQAFIKRGWVWGGDWGARGYHDYHHFEKPLSAIQSIDNP